MKPRRTKQTKEPRPKKKRATSYEHLSERRAELVAMLAAVDAQLHRNEQIWADYQAEPRKYGLIKRLSEKYKLDRSRIHAILREMEKVHRDGRRRVLPGIALTEPPISAPDRAAPIAVPPVEPGQKLPPLRSRTGRYTDELLAADLEVARQSLLGVQANPRAGRNQMGEAIRQAVDDLNAIIPGVRRRKKQQRDGAAETPWLFPQE